MVLEVVTLVVKDNEEDAFQAAYAQATHIIASATGHISHELLKCVEVERKYLLLVHWNTLEDHTIGFRQSEAYQQWRQLLHHFYESIAVEHFTPTALANAQ